MGDRDRSLTIGPMTAVIKSGANLLATALALGMRVLRSFYRNLSLLALALALSITLWAVVTAEQNPRVEGTFPSDIPVTPVNIPSGLDVFDEIDAVRVRISAPQNDWSALRTNSFTAQVDLARRGAGRGEARVEVRPSNPQVRVLEVMPERVTVWLEQFTKREFPVRVITQGEPTPDFRYGQAKPEREKVTVMGPASLVDEVDSVVAEVNLEGAKVTINQVFALSARSLQGRKLDGVRLDPSSMAIEVPVEQLIFYKTVPVHPVIHGDPASGYWIESISVDPSIVLIGGSRELLESISFIQTEPMVVADAVNTQERSVLLKLPEGAYGASHQQVRMKVTVSPVEGTKSFIVASVVIGLPAGRYAVADPVEVTLKGLQTVLQQVDPASVRVTLDATGLLAGTHMLTPQVAAPERTRVVKVAPEKVRTVIN